MNILLCGASGFVGRHLEAALRAAGHQVKRGVRQPRGESDIGVDYRHDMDIATWLPRLRNIDAVINAVGVLRDSKVQPMSCLHDAVPRALFAAAAQSGIQRIVQISALGVSTGINTPYMQTKQAADDFLQTLNVDWAILRPSLLYGKDGASTRLFMLLSHLPLVMLPGGGKQIVQPLHITDLAQAVVKLLALPSGSPPLRSVIECVGDDEVTMATLIASYATQRCSRAPWILAMPSPLLNTAAWLGDRIPALPIGSDTLTMLAAGTIGHGDRLAQLLGRPPIHYQAFLCTA
jgi:uncharacterized protein YbjT (DUF2867 family)